VATGDYGIGININGVGAEGDIVGTTTSIVGVAKSVYTVLVRSGSRADSDSGADVTGVGTATPRDACSWHEGRVMTGAVAMGVVLMTRIGVGWLPFGVCDCVATGDDGIGTEIDGVGAGGEHVCTAAIAGVTNSVYTVPLRTE
jgi:hypothetical protein